MRLILYICVILFIKNSCCANKYSKEANIKKDDYKDLPSLRTLEKPYRMAKLNLLWSKAQHRLTDAKLKSLFGELKLHDKEELTFKKIKAEGGDKDGLKEAEMRKKLIGIMSSYDLLEHFNDVQDSSKYKQHKAFNEASEDQITKSLFKDKKLNKLWKKAEQSGFTADELRALKEEFTHHQDKIEEYYSILQNINEGQDDQHENSIDDKLDRFNTLEAMEEQPKKDYHARTNELRDKHRDLREGYDRLNRLAAKGPNSKEFIEPKVQGLWKIALDTNFTPDELESLRIELMHYENRLLKLRNMQAEHALTENNMKVANEKHDGLIEMVQNIKKQAKKVEKLHLDLETRIMQRHIEL